MSSIWNMISSSGSKLTILLLLLLFPPSLLPVAFCWPRFCWLLTFPLLLVWLWLIFSPLDILAECHESRFNDL
ncbi:hypothetical protein F4815DRAFT_463505, partial [Daldinia loculata]